MNAMGLVERANGGAEHIDRIVVIHDFPRAEGGAGTLACLAANQFAKRGIDVTFFSGACDQAGDTQDGIEHVGLHGRALLQLSRAAAMRQGFQNVEARDALRRWISLNDTDRTVYHLHNWSQILSPAIFDALRPVEHRVVATCHDFFNVCPNGGFTNFRKSQPCDLRPMSAACVTSNCDRRSGLHKAWRVARHANLLRLARFGSSQATFTFIHSRMRDRFVAGGFAAHDTEIVPNPVTPWTDERIEGEKNSGFLFVGRIGKDKGADLAAQAAQEAGVGLTLAGTGELEQELGAGNDLIRLAGWCDPRALRELASKARALIVPSRVVEPFGLVILEAAASGLPVIVSDRAYLAEDVLRCGFGEVFDPGKPAQLHEILVRWLADDVAVRRMSEAGMTHAANLSLGPDEWAEQFLEIFGRKLALARKLDGVA